MKTKTAVRVGTETLSLNYDRITWKYWPLGPVN